MNPGGIFLALLGVWVGAQVFRGQALERLAIVGDS